MLTDFSFAFAAFLFELLPVMHTKYSDSSSINTLQEFKLPTHELSTLELLAKHFICATI